MTDLPPLDCAGCRKCCIGDLIPLVPGDHPTQYKTSLVEGVRVLRHRHGSCVYLGKSGCKIHGSAPQMCRAFDCRAYYLRYEHDAEGLKQRLGEPHLREVILEGRRRVNRLRAGSL